MVMLQSCRYRHADMRRPGFEPGLEALYSSFPLSEEDWQAPVIPLHYRRDTIHAISVYMRLRLRTETILL